MLSDFVKGMKFAGIVLSVLAGMFSLVLVVGYSLLLLPLWTAIPVVVVAFLLLGGVLGVVLKNV